MPLVFVPLVTCVALALYLMTIVNVGRARRRYGIKPPAVSGHPDFDRYFRVQQNTLEQLALFLPGLWLFGWYQSDMWGALLGSVWIMGRGWYAWGYYTEAKRRMPGFVMGQFTSIILLLGAFAGIVSSL